MFKSYGATTAPSQCTTSYYNYYDYYIIIIFIIIIIIIIITIIIIIIVIIWKGYFSVNPILNFCSFESKKVFLLMWS